jgi:serine/threonine protein kinase
MAENQPFDSPSAARSPDFTKTVETPGQASQIQCPACGLAVASGTRFCPNDSTPLNGGIETKTVTNYRFLRLIGEGGMANVYEAEHVVLKKRVAIKVLKAHLHETSAFIRFQHEAQTASRVRHPNIVGVYDCGMSELGEPYMVMDLVVGETLDKQLKNGPLSINESLEIIKQVCAGVACAHENGVLHRDLKPSNIILEDQSKEKVARVLDFGIAKIVEDSSNAALKTRTGELIGTPAYMSPEQIGGGTLDQRSDIFALGCILYELLTGQPPVVGNSIMEIMYKQVNEQPCSLSQASLGRKFPKQLENIVSRSIDKEPSDRFATAKRMLIAIENFQAGKNVDNEDESIQPATYKSPGKANLPAFNSKSSNSSKSSNNSNSSKWLKVPLIISGVILLISFCAITIYGVMKSDAPTNAPNIVTHFGVTKSVDMSAVEQNASSNMADLAFKTSLSNMGDVQSLVLPEDCSDASLKLVKNLKLLHSLNLKNCRNLTINGLKNIANMPNLQELVLSSTKLNTVEAMQLISRMPHLTALDLTDVLGEDRHERKLENDKALQALTGPPGLDRLILNEAMITDQGLINLRQLKKVTKLELDRCPYITDAGVAKLAEMPSLWDFHLNHCPALSDQVGKQLGKFKKLKKIELFDTAASDQTLKDLSRLHLAGLDLQKCPSVSREAAMKFGEEHHCLVQWSDPKQDKKMSATDFIP